MLIIGSLVRRRGSGSVDGGERGAGAWCWGDADTHVHPGASLGALAYVLAYLGAQPHIGMSVLRPTLHGQLMALLFLGPCVRACHLTSWDERLALEETLLGIHEVAVPVRVKLAHVIDGLDAALRAGHTAGVLEGNALLNAAEEDAGPERNVCKIMDQLRSGRLRLNGWQVIHTGSLAP